MRCAQCHFENRDGVSFCEECGAKLELTCFACGAAVPPGRRFCGNCGQSLSLSVAGVSRFPSPDSYTPKHLAERILTSKAALEGERKQVTVLFADLKGSMELLADRDPEEARKILDPVLEHMMEAVHRYEGTVNQVMGDGIMALFGAPLAHEDHAVRACYAALRMQDTAKQFAEEVGRTQGILPRIRVGLNSGEVVVRAIGSDLHMDYTAVGQTTHLAARMEQLADPDTVLLTSDAVRLAEGFVEVVALGARAVKGMPVPITVYELIGVGRTRARFDLAVARGLTHLVGREAELEELQVALERARAGNGQLVAVVGEPGVGKSRLIWELIASHVPAGFRVLHSRSVSHGKATSYLPLVDLLTAYFGLDQQGDVAAARARITDALLALDATLGRNLTALLTLIGFEVDDPQWEFLDPPQRQEQTIASAKRLLLKESIEQPLLVVFEDLHWIDRDTQHFLDSFIEALPSARILLLVNYRPEYRHARGAARATTRKCGWKRCRPSAQRPSSARSLAPTWICSPSSGC
jgi:class 3 adenylate cyclase